MFFLLSLFMVLYFITFVPRYQHIYIFISGNLKPSLYYCKRFGVYCSQIVVTPELKLMKGNNFLKQQVLQTHHQAIYISPEISSQRSGWLYLLFTIYLGFFIWCLLFTISQHQNWISWYEMIFLNKKELLAHHQATYISPETSSPCSVPLYLLLDN